MLSLTDFEPIKVGSYRGGGYWSAHCLWPDLHERGADRSASLLIYRDGFFICKSCGAQGGFDKLYRRMCEVGGRAVDHQKLSEAGTRLLPQLPTDPSGVDRFCAEAHERLMQFPSLGWYLDQRKVESQIEPARLGWWDGWITLPVLDAAGGVKGVVLRATPVVQHQTGLRFTMPAGQTAMLYCPDWRRLDSEPCIFVVYGMLDALTLAKYRYAVVTTTAGKDSFKPEWLDRFRKPIYFLADKGEDNATNKRPLTYGMGWRGHGLHLDWPDGIKDPNDYDTQGKWPLLASRLDACRTRYDRRSLRQAHPAKPALP
jgi:hypothetical protein